MSMFHISSGRIVPERLRRKLADARAGGVVSFEGRVRSRSGGRKVHALEYEVYGELAAKEGERILSEARRKFAIRSATCAHRVGRLQIGEIAVWIGVSAEHRDAAFAACRYIIDQLKARVPIWKKEHHARGSSRWVQPVSHARRTPILGEKGKTCSSPQSARVRPGHH